MKSLFAFNVFLVFLSLSLGVAGCDKRTATDDGAKGQPGVKKAGKKNTTKGKDGGAKELDTTGGEGSGMSVEETRARWESVNNLRRLASATHLFHDQHGRFPPAAGEAMAKREDLQGFSWRVYIMPHVDLAKPYFDILDGKKSAAKAGEPWNRPDLVTLSLIPFASPLADKVKEPWHTHYRVFVGPGAAYEKGKATGLSDFPDGPENTLLIAEAAEPAPFPKPEELDFDPAKPLPKLGGLWNDGFYAAFADAQIRFIRKDTSEKALRAWITRNGGEKVELPPLVDSLALIQAAGLGEQGPDIKQDPKKKQPKGKGAKKLSK